MKGGEGGFKDTILITLSKRGLIIFHLRLVIGVIMVKSAFQHGKQTVLKIFLS